MYRVFFALWLCDVRQPLCSETRPLQGMGHHQVIEKGSVFLPYLVLLIDDPLFYSFIIGWTYRTHKKIGDT